MKQRPRVPLREGRPELYAELVSLVDGTSKEEVTTGSPKRGYWKGACGHEWEAEVKARTRRSSGCPFCSGHLVLPGFNDLATLFPGLVEEWHLLNRIAPSAVSPGATDKFLWVCGVGHSWVATATLRTRHGSGCPSCRKEASKEAPKNSVAQHHRTRAERPLSKVQKERMQKVLAFFPRMDEPPGYSSLFGGGASTVEWSCPMGHKWIALPKTVLKHLESNGHPCVECRDLPKAKNDVASSFPHLVKEWSPENLLRPEQVSRGSAKKIRWECLTGGHTWEAHVYSRAKENGSGCPRCQTGVSRDEEELLLWLTELLPEGVNIVTNDRSILGGQELDIYLPQYHLAIEFNGIYWHTEQQGKDRKYHYQKWEACQKVGVQLIHLWEDDWRLNKELVKGMLSHKLGLGRGTRVMARKTTVSGVSQKEAKEFLEANHIQGNSNGSIRLGLRISDGSLVACMIARKVAGREGTYLISRYATSQHVVGGFTKLLSRLEKESDVNTVMTFSDNGVSDGALYRQNGFVTAGALAPDKKYVYGKIRCHKFNFRLKRFREDPKLLWDESMSERELAVLNDIPWIWDAGKIRWIKEVS